MATKGVSRLTSALYEHKAFHSHANPQAIVDRPPMTDDEANQFLAAFNKGETTFEGRLWALTQQPFRLMSLATHFDQTRAAIIEQKE
jgi:hypothetical protein